MNWKNSSDDSAEKGKAMNKIPVIAVVGATASGKTSLAVEIAKRFDGEIVSADSMQIYKGMNIATAKPTEEEKQGIPHYLIDFLPVTEKYSVAEFVKQAGGIISDIYSRGKLPIVCGGTGLYIDSLLNNMSYAEQPDNTEIREKLQKRADELGTENLLEELMQIDGDYASQLHINNRGRIIRALEMYYLTGEKPTVLRERAKSNESPYEPFYISIEYKDRQKLYDRIDRRVDEMFRAGLEEEAKEYFSLDKKSTASQAIGYKELSGYFSGDITLEQASQNLKQATRRYAKRQLTWFRRNEFINRIYADCLPENETVYNIAFNMLTDAGFDNERK